MKHSLRSRWGSRAVAVLAAVVVVSAPVAADGAPGTGASATMARTWGVNGRVLAIAPAGDVTVVAGAFDTGVGPAGDQVPLPSVGRFRPATGTFDRWPVSVDGPVNSVVVDGDTVYLGGDFRHVNGALRISLAAVSLSTGALLPWAPQANVWVDTLAVSGGWVYLGGAFTTVTDGSGAVPAPYLARVSAADGSVDQTWTGGIALDAPVYSVLPNAAGTGVFVGGDFGAVNGQGYAAHLTLLSTGTTPVIDPVFRSGTTNGTNHAPAAALALDGNALLIGASGSGGGCTLQDATTGANRWSYHTNGNVVAVAFLGPKAYCAGHFNGSNSFNGLTRNKIAEMTTSTGAITAFKPSVNSALGIFALASTPTALFAGGDFTKVGTTTQPMFGLFADLGALTAPAPPGTVTAIPGSGQVVLAWDTPEHRRRGQDHELQDLPVHRHGQGDAAGEDQEPQLPRCHGEQRHVLHLLPPADQLGGAGPKSVTASATPLGAWSSRLRRRRASSRLARSGPPTCRGRGR